MDVLVDGYNTGSVILRHHNNCFSKASQNRNVLLLSDFSLVCVEYFGFILIE